VITLSREQKDEKERRKRMITNKKGEIERKRERGGRERKKEK
jgi:hypothetical protein